MVNYTGLLLPTGATPGRRCDLSACARPATDLVAEPDGSILMVCEQHQAELVSPTASDDGSAFAEVHEGGPGRRGTRRVLRLAALILGCALTLVGLGACAQDPVRHLSGILPGVVGTWLVLRVLRPRLLA